MDVKIVLPGLELVNIIIIQTTLVIPYKSYPHHTYTNLCMCTRHAGIVLLSGPKIGFSPRSGDTLAG